MLNSLEIDVLPEAAEGATVIQLRGQATYREAPELRTSLFESIGQYPDGRLVIELAEVSKIDTAAMAVLIEGLIATRQKGPDVYFCTPSESVRKVFRLAGLEEALERCYGCIGDLPASDASCGCE